MKRYYRFLIAIALGLCTLLVLLVRNNWKFAYLFGGELTGGVVSFSYANTSSWGFGEEYEIFFEGETPYLKMSIKNLDFLKPEFSGNDHIKDGAYTKTFALPPNLLKELQKVANKHKIWRRSGNYHDARVVDGDSWTFSMQFGNGEAISAHGYMASPEGFWEGMRAFLALFEQEYTQTKEKADMLLETLRQPS